jgi:hypothetical protein
MVLTGAVKDCARLRLSLCLAEDRRVSNQVLVALSRVVPSTYLDVLVSHVCAGALAPIK